MKTSHLILGTSSKKREILAELIRLILVFVVHLLHDIFEEHAWKRICNMIISNHISDGIISGHI